MEQDQLIKYIMWIAFFILASAAVYNLFKSLGIVG